MFNKVILTRYFRIERHTDELIAIRFSDNEKEALFESPGKEILIYSKDNIIVKHLIKIRSTYFHLALLNCK